MGTERYRDEVIRLSNGIRFPLLIDTSSGLPDGIVCDYSLAYHYAKPINSTQPVVDTIGSLLSWAHDRRIDLEQRFRSGDLFTSDEVTSLAEALWGRRNGSPVGEKVGDDAAIPRSVVGTTQATRIDRVVHFITWRIGQVVSALPVHDPRVANINARLATNVNQLVELKGKSVSKPRGMLTEEQCVRLFEIVRPGSDDNPFHRDTQLRNFFALLLLYELGVRRAEPLVIKVQHLAISARSNVFLTHTPNDVRDPRINQPSLKTLSRILPLGKVLATTADRLLRERRANARIAAAAKKTPFLMLDSDKGQPLSLDAFDDLFVVLRKRFPDELPSDFAAHHLRRSWNHRFSEECEKAKVDPELGDHIRRYVMGWSKTSEQPANYNRKFIEEQAFNILLGMQNALTGEQS